MIDNCPLQTGPCNENDFERVKEYIDEFELDNRRLFPSEFTTLKTNNRILGFGRIRNYGSFSELCSLGIIKPARFMGLGKMLSQKILSKVKQTVYVVCIIPTFFEQMGFVICTDFPSEIQQKLNYCTSSLPVSEKYVVMRKIIA